MSKIRTAMDCIKRRGPKTLTNKIICELDKKLLLSNPMSYPSFIQLEPTTGCNLKCEMCEHSYWSQINRQMSYKEFVHIIEQFPFLDSINLTGIGESLLNKDFLEMVGYLKKKKVRVFFNTNATLLNEKVSKKLVESGLDEIHISFDAATPETYNKIRKGADFHKVINNIKKLVETKKRMNKDLPKIRIVCMMMKNNFYELPKLVELAKELGVDDISFFEITTFDKIKSMAIKGIDKKQAFSIFKRIEENAKERNIKTEICSNSLLGTKYGCILPWITCFITCEGYVMPCCQVTQKNDRDKMIERFSFGNLLEDDFRNIWKSKKYKNFRKSLKTGNLPSICKECPYYQI